MEAKSKILRPEGKFNEDEALPTCNIEVNWEFLWASLLSTIDQICDC